MKERISLSTIADPGPRINKTVIIVSTRKDVPAYSVISSHFGLDFILLEIIMMSTGMQISATAPMKILLSVVKYFSPVQLEGDPFGLNRRKPAKRERQLKIVTTRIRICNTNDVMLRRFDIIKTNGLSTRKL